MTRLHARRASRGIGTGMSAVADQATAPTPLLRVQGLSKTFPGLKALDDVSFSVGAGEIVAVVGHNGSGKSTLVKILADVYQPDPGATIEVCDVTGNLLGDAAARKGLHFIHQDLGLINMLSTIENMGLGRSARGRGLGPVRTVRERDDARRLVARFGAQFDPTVPVALLSPAERAIVAIARAMDGWTVAENVLVLDEPTTAFHGDEVEVLFGAVRHVAAQGAGLCSSPTGSTRCWAWRIAWSPCVTVGSWPTSRPPRLITIRWSS